ncbi:hypothetical protein K402DRAFT_387974 [Aulographum hederae CBS 113979]|uniref:Uncharacterized protein n=1 Tax=Aulographum hederae CBS 113979 TaxID=1176131 RepID=A0A6G1HGN1_9PEZI|nr:hypothetical protein K402DRAFT_387974 [Aulographum hederae CBS 113979]
MASVEEPNAGDTKCYLLAISGELRNKIYFLTLPPHMSTRKTPVLTASGEGLIRRTTITAASTPVITRVCSQIRREALSLWCEDTTFKLCKDDFSPLQWRGSIELAWLRSIEILVAFLKFRADDPLSPDYLLLELQNDCKTLVIRSEKQVDKISTAAFNRRLAQMAQMDRIRTRFDGAYLVHLAFWIWAQPQFYFEVASASDLNAVVPTRDNRTNIDLATDIKKAKYLRFRHVVASFEPIAKERIATRV